MEKNTRKILENPRKKHFEDILKKKSYIFLTIFAQKLGNLKKNKNFDYFSNFFKNNG